MERDRKEKGDTMKQEKTYAIFYGSERITGGFDTEETAQEFLERLKKWAEVREDR